MRNFAVKLMMLAAGFGGVTAAAAQGVVAQLQDAGEISAADVGSGKLHFRIENQGSDSIHILSWGTPLGDEMTANLFRVEQNGVRARYIGAMVKRAEPTEEDYFELKPGQSRTVDVDLSAYYDLRNGGAYEVSYAPHSGELILEASAVQKSGAKIARPVETQSATIWVDAGARSIDSIGPIGARGEVQSLQSRLPAGTGVLAAAAASNSYVKCTNTQQTQIVPARDSAVVYANNAKSYLATGAAGSRYTWWFGAYTSGNYALITTHYNNLVSALSTQPYTFDCGCKQKRTYAFVYPDQPYTVHLCGAFWSAPNTGTDSRAGTLIHESSHFTVVAGTDDYAYGQTAAHNLALTNVAQALMNADSHEYFAENNPALN